MVENKILNFKDTQDYISENLNIKKRSPVGRVQIYEKKIEGSDKSLFLLRDIDNLIVYRGRHWLMQKAFNKNYGAELVKDLYLSWFAIGTGGALQGSPLTPTSPNLTNTTLAAHGTLGADSSTIITFNGKQYHTFDGASVPPQYPIYEQDPEVAPEVGSDGYLVAKITITLGAAEGNGKGESGSGGGAEYQDINEAGLFISDSHINSPLPTKMEIFARTTFSTIRKYSGTSIVFNWYIFF